jgi:hypothetical protein
MRMRLLGLMGLLCLFAVTAAHADQITLKNGDRVTGAIVKKDSDKLTIAGATIGTVTIPWDQIDSISADKPVWVQAGGASEMGTFTLSGGQLTLTPTSGSARTIAIADVQAIRNSAEQEAYSRMLSPKLYELWAGTANLGFAGTGGNARTKTFTLAANAARVTNTDKASLYFNDVTASALVNGANAETARAVRGGWAYQRDLRMRIFANLFNDYEFDRFQSLDLRLVLGADAGYHAVKNDRTRLDLLAGLDYSHAQFSTPLTRNAAEFSWGDDFDHKLNGTVSLIQSYRMFNSLTDSPNFRVTFDFGATARLKSWLIWNLTFSDRYLRNPVPGRLSNDVLYSTGLGVRFGRP